MAVRNSTQRFSSRVQEYQCFRPGYPEAVTQLLQAECGLASSSAVADVASGTGIFTRMLLDTGASVAGVEPNPEMRRAGEIFLSKYPKFSSVTGTAEATALADSSVDLLTAAQAAHWFNLGEARREF